MYELKRKRFEKHFSGLITWIFREMINNHLLSDLTDFFFCSFSVFVLSCSVDEFAEAFIIVLRQDKNGSVWIIDGGKFKEITFARPWYDIAVESTSTVHTS